MEVICSSFECKLTKHLLFFFSGTVYLLYIIIIVYSYILSPWCDLCGWLGDHLSIHHIQYTNSVTGHLFNKPNKPITLYIHLTEKQQRIQLYWAVCPTHLCQCPLYAASVSPRLRTHAWSRSYKDNATLSTQMSSGGIQGFHCCLGVCSKVGGHFIFEIWMGLCMHTDTCTFPSCVGEWGVLFVCFIA